jgi:hypothetical protein
MNLFEDDIVAEVRRNRIALLEEHGGIEGLRTYMSEERPRLEREGWVFVDLDEMLGKKHAKKRANG